MKPENSTQKPMSSGIKYLIGIPFITGIAIALLAPTDVLKYSAFQTINEIASYIFPAVRKMKGDYELGEVAKLYFSVMWLMSPLMFIGGYRDMERQAEKVIPKMREKKLLFLFFFGVFLPACAILGTVANFESNDLNDVRTLLTFHSRWGMPIWGFMIPAGASVLYAMTAFWIRNFVRIFG